MGSGFSKMKKQAKLMEQQLETLRSEMKDKRFTGSSGNGLVEITLNGDKELVAIAIKPECVDVSDLEGLQDLIRAAHNAATAQVAQQQSPSGFPGAGSLLF